MPGLPEFMPAQSPSEASRVANETAMTRARIAESRSSIMERAAQSQRAQQQLELEREKWDVMRPVLQAQAGANIAMAGAELANAKATQDARARMATAFPQAQREFELMSTLSYQPAPVDADGNPKVDDQGNPVEGQRDWQGAFEGYQDLAAKYNWMSLVPEGRQFLDRVHEQAISAHQMVMADNLAQATMARTNVEQAGLNQREQMRAQWHQSQIESAERTRKGIAQQEQSLKDPAAILQDATRFDALARQYEDTGNSAMATMYRESAARYRDLSRRISQPLRKDRASRIDALTGGTAPGSPAPQTAPAPQSRTSATGPKPATAPAQTTVPQFVSPADYQGRF